MTARRAVCGEYTFQFIRVGENGFAISLTKNGRQVRYLASLNLGSAQRNLEEVASRFPELNPLLVEEIALYFGIYTGSALQHQLMGLEE